MYETNLKISCENSELIKKSLEPDIKNTEDVHTEIIAKPNLIEIRIKSKKLSYMKAIINSYLSIISMLTEAERIK